MVRQVVAKAAKAELTRKGTLVEQIKEAINSDEQGLQLPDLDILLENLEEKKHDMQQREKENSLELLLHFLNHSRSAVLSLPLIQDMLAFSDTQPSLFSRICLSP